MGGTATDRKQERGQQDPFLMVAGSGFEPGESGASKSLQMLSAQQIRGLKNHKIA